jgi:arginyl-tRNA synthetase
MNIFDKFLKEIKSVILKNEKTLNLLIFNDFKGVVVESPPEKFDYDLSCNVCMVLSKLNNQNSNDIAEKIKLLLLKDIKNIKNIEIAGPGFLNIKLNDNYILETIKNILQSSDRYGSKNNNKKYNIEFVSANPTGPMHVGHCRGAIYGDVLANLLKFNGNTVTKEYYINDYGNQIKNFTKSVFLRIKEIKFKEKFVKSDDLYPGEYIIEIAQNILKDNPKIDYKSFEDCYKKLSKECLNYSMKMIKLDLQKLGIKHDNFFSETDIVNKKLVDKAVSFLKKNNFVEDGYLDPPKGDEIKNWKKIKRLIFKSTLFGDDADRALQKNDGSWTYFANDVAYHSDKVKRNYDFLINVLGADHTGYIKRISAAVKALSKNKTQLDCKICQLVKLFKDGKPYKMSKRAGDFISVNELLKEVNKDSIRFMMLNRSNDVELDFDFDKILEKTKDNPVFYIQYCYARINSLFNSLNISLSDPIKVNEDDFNLNKYEIKILRKIYDWPKLVDTAAVKNEPHRIPFYLYDLATLFHSYWSKGNENDKYKFILNGKINNQNSLIIPKILSLVLENGMRILGVSLPKRM